MSIKVTATGDSDRVLAIEEFRQPDESGISVVGMPSPRDASWTFPDLETADRFAERAQYIGGPKVKVAVEEA